MENWPDDSWLWWLVLERLEDMWSGSALSSPWYIALWLGFSTSFHFPLLSFCSGFQQIRQIFTFTFFTELRQYCHMALSWGEDKIRFLAFQSQANFRVLPLFHRSGIGNDTYFCIEQFLFISFIVIGSDDFLLEVLIFSLVTDGGFQLTGSVDFSLLTGYPKWPFRCLCGIFYGSVWGY